MAIHVDDAENIFHSNRRGVKSINGSNNLNTLPTTDKLDLTYKFPEGIIRKPDAGKSLFQYRYLVAVLGFTVFCQMNSYRLVTSFSIVAMINDSAVSYDSNSSTKILLCSVNSSFEEDSVYSEIQGEFNWTPDTQGYILSAGFLSFVITLIPAGMLSEIYGGKIIIVIGLLISTLGHLFSPLAAYHSSQLMIVAQLIRGAGQGLMMSAYPVIASNWFPSIERGLFNSLVISGISFGAMFSGISAGALCSSSFLGGWPSVYYIFGSLGLLQCLCMQIFLYESPKVHPNITDKEKDYILYYQESNLSKKRPPTPWKDIITSLPFYVMSYAMFGSYWAAAHLLNIHPIFLTTVLHFSLKENGFIISIVFTFQMMLSLITSFISNYLSRTNLVGVDWLRKGINLIAVLGYSLGLVGMYFAGCNKGLSNWLSIIGMSFNGCVFGGALIVPLDMSPTFSGTLMGLSTTLASLAAFILPVIYGVMIEKDQSLDQWNNIFFISIAVLMTSGIIFCFFGSAEVQPWNYVSEDRTRNNCSDDKGHNIGTEETNLSVEAVVHL